MATGLLNCLTGLGNTIHQRDIDFDFGNTFTMAKIKTLAVDEFYTPTLAEVISALQSGDISSEQLTRVTMAPPLPFSNCGCQLGMFYLMMLSLEIRRPHQ